MFLGRVIGSVWSTAKSNELTGVKFILVRPFRLKDLQKDNFVESTGDCVIAADNLGAGTGEIVVIAFGHAGRVAYENTPPGEKTRVPIDAAVVAIVDKYNLYDK